MCLQLDAFFFQLKSSDIFLFLHENIILLLVLIRNASATQVAEALLMSTHNMLTMNNSRPPDLSESSLFTYVIKPSFLGFPSDLIVLLKD